MDLTLVSILRCPSCAGGPLEADPVEVEGDRCVHGTVTCRACSSRYPILDRILELLPPGAEDPGNPAFREQAHQRAHFDEIARRDDEFSYDALEMLPFQQALRRISFGGWRPLLADGSLVLDIGCANGISSFNISKPGIKVLGFDISREQIAQATARARAEGIDATFIVADGNDIPVADETIDCVLAYGSLHHMPDPARTLHEADRVLKPGGLYLGLENHKTPLRPFFDLLMRLRPVWKEEAGAEAQMGAKELANWTADSDLALQSRPTVYAPPHLFNRLRVSAAERLMRWMDAFFGRIPLLRNWAGMITIEGAKSVPAPSAARSAETNGSQGRSPLPQRRGG